MDLIEESGEKKIPRWDCVLDPGEGPLSVGKVFFLTCQGENVPWDGTKIELKFSKPELRYVLKILEVKNINETEAIFAVTTYLTGPHEYTDLILTDGQNSVSISPLQWNVPSLVHKTLQEYQKELADLAKENVPLAKLLKSGEPVEEYKEALKTLDKEAPELAAVLQGRESPMKPFGPYGPLTLSFPVWYWLILAAVLVLVGIFSFFKIRKHLVRKRLIEKIRGSRVDPDAPEVSALYHSALSPFHQYTRTLRQMNREHHFTGRRDHSFQMEKGEQVEHFIAELDKSFRLYIAREMLVPALDWKSAAVIADIKKRHRKIFKKMGKNIRVAFQELDRATANRDQITAVDCVQISKICGEVAIAVNKVKRKNP